MDLQTKEGRCSAICWIIGVVVAIFAYVVLRPGVWILVALVIAAVLGCVVALLLIRYFCASDRSQDWAASEPASKSPAAVAAPAAAPAPAAGAAVTSTTPNRAAGIVPADGATAEYDEAQEGVSTATTSAAAFAAPGDGKAWDDAAEDASEAKAEAKPASKKPAAKAKAAAKTPAKAPAKAKPAPVAEPAAQTTDAGATGQKPAALSAARDGAADDLKRIKGVGPKLEILLNELGVYHFDQVAAWGPAEVAWVDQNLKGFKGRVSRDGWVAQATTLAAGGETEFSQRVDKGGVY